MTIKATPIRSATGKFPHVDEIADWPAQQSLKLLWAHVTDLTARLTAAESTVTTLVTTANTTASTASEALTKAKAALALSQVPGAASRSETAEGGGDLPGGGDGGSGQIGCSAAGPTGHDTGGLLNAIRAGQIICGTGNEFPALKNPTATVDARKTNANELLLRMIWHLKQAGFTAGRQRNPSGLISPDKLAVVVDGVTRAYDVFIAYDNNTIPLQTQMDEVAPPNLVDDAGTPDS